jgi:hypothetical protein
MGGSGSGALSLVVGRAHLVIPLMFTSLPSPYVGGPFHTSTTVVICGGWCSPPPPPLSLSRFLGGRSPPPASSSFVVGGHFPSPPPLSLSSFLVGGHFPPPSSFVVGGRSPPHRRRRHSFVGDRSPPLSSSFVVGPFPTVIDVRGWGHSSPSLLSLSSFVRGGRRPRDNVTLPSSVSHLEIR